MRDDHLVRLPLPVLVLVLLSACADGEGTLEGPSLVVPDCKVQGKDFVFEPFRMSLASISVHEADDVATIRLGSRPGGLTEVDQIGLVLYDVPALRARLAAEGEVPVELVVGQDEQGIFTLGGRTTGLMTVALLESCTHTTAALGGVGRFFVTAYGGARNGDAIAGRLEIDLVDRRTGRLLGQGLRGDIDFVVDTSAPYAAFAPKDY